MNIEIKNRFSGEIIVCGKYESIQECVNKHKEYLRRANLREANLREADLRRANLREANLRGANLRRANLREANLRGANLREANLREANLWGADLQGANLREANLRRADLRGANLQGANLWGADLWEANHDLKLPIISIRGSRNSIDMINGKIKIGCEVFTIEHLQKNYKDIGEKNDYTPEQIEEYKKYIDMCAEAASG